MTRAASAGDEPADSIDVKSGGALYNQASAVGKQRLLLVG